MDGRKSTEAEKVESERETEAKSNESTRLGQRELLVSETPAKSGVF